ncbi:hypothetical protein XENOCAPTIV_017087 [Xenoophorus captivus]|uniref:Transposase Tc1-like domain-containing protein n=1 Tax=Xenoophorus captivus TaxID=1517983 RepID=A0ABV0S114_9TELE
MWKDILWSWKRCQSVFEASNHWHASSRENILKKILNDCDQRSIKHLVKSNRRKTTVELQAMFNRKSKSISPHTMRRELKGLGLNSCVALRKPLISEDNRK